MEAGRASYSASVNSGGFILTLRRLLLNDGRVVLSTAGRDDECGSKEADKRRFVE